jgi:hypothetical protein
LWTRAGAPGGASDDVTLIRPPQVVAGRLMIAVIRTRDTSPTIVSAPTGWTLLDGPRLYGISSRNAVWIYYKVATASEPNSYTWDVGGAVTVGADYGFLHVFDVDDVKTPINASAFAVSNSLTPAQVTTTRANTQLLNIFFADEGDSGTRLFVPPSNLYEVFAIHDSSSTFYVENSRGVATSAGTTALSNYATSALTNNGYKATIAVAPATVPAVLNLTPSGSEISGDAVAAPLTFTPSSAETYHVGTMVDSGTVSVNLAPSAIEVYHVGIAIDSAVGLLKLIPSGVDTKVTAYVDSGTVRLTFTPKFQGTTYIDSTTVGLAFKPLGLDTLAAFDYVDPGIVLLRLSFSSTEVAPRGYVDAVTVGLKYTVITEHECLAHLRPQFQAEAFNRYSPIAYRHIYAADVYARWYGAVTTALPVPDPC